MRKKVKSDVGYSVISANKLASVLTSRLCTARSRKDHASLLTPSTQQGRIESISSGGLASLLSIY
jgi:hypothetical protein